MLKISDFISCKTRLIVIWLSMKNIFCLLKTRSISSLKQRSRPCRAFSMMGSCGMRARWWREGLIARALSTILLIDSWIGVGTLDMLAKKRDGVDVQLVTSPRGNQLAASDIAKFNAQYPTLTIKTSTAFHDRFLIIDDKELYLVGASLKDLGRKCFGFTRMDAGEIAGLKARI